MNKVSSFHEEPKMSEQQREPSNAKAEAAKKTAESADVANEELRHLWWPGDHRA